MIQLRPFQENMIADARAKLRANRAILIQLPTGGGKTVLSSFMIRSAVERKGRPWFICHRDFLVEQTSLTLTRVGVEHGFIAAGRPFNPYLPAQVCSIQTLASRLDRVPRQCWPTIMFFDEGHHIAAGSWARASRAFPDAKLIGLSATPERLDGKPLRDFFGDMVTGPSVEWLIANGYLSKYRAFAPSTPDLHGVQTRAGDFASDQLETVMDTSILIGDIVGHYKRLALGRRAIYFGVSVHHSRNLAAAFNAAGVRALHLDGTSPLFERVQAARAVARGEIDVLTNVDLFGEGYDLAAQAGQDVTIEAVGLCRPTQSLAMYMQQVGRALRPKTEPAVILDHAGNIVRHGLPDEDRVWSLEGRDKKRKASEPSVPSPRICTACLAQFRAFLTKCPECGTPVPVAMKQPDVIDGELEEIDKEQVRRERRMQEQAAQSVDELIRVGQARGYKRAAEWAAHVFTARARAGQSRVEDQARAYRR